MHLLGLLLEDLDEDAADDLALLLGIGDAAQRREEPLARVDGDEVQVEVLAERRDDLLGLAQAQQAVVDEDARQPVAERLVAEDGRDRRVDAAREAADDVVVARHLRADARRWPPR